ncbi:hypothetical protein D3C85_1785140 [compost metagenome]
MPTAILLKKQNPIERALSAWCPGGRIEQNAFGASLLHTMSTAFTTAPAARLAACRVPGHIAVSGSTRKVPTDGEHASMYST